MFMLSVLWLQDANIKRVVRQLAAKIRQAPDFFRNMPVVIDLEVLAAQRVLLDFPALVQALREHGMVPVGVRNGSEDHNSAATLAGLALLWPRRARQPSRPETAASNQEETPADSKNGAAKPSGSNAQSSVVVVHPVRSGQQVYARGSDLVVIAPVSVGSELIADGNIHVYGPLRGRALAGVTGDQTRRIFCQHLEAELVAIAGHYQVSEELAPELKGKPVQIRLDEGRLITSPIEHCHEHLTAVGGRP